MATYEPSKLAEGTVNVVQAPIASPSGVKWLVHSIIFHNVSAVPATLQLYYNSGTAIRIMAFDIPADDTIPINFSGSGLGIEDGETLEATANLAGAVNYILSGSSRTA
jgi:hypothetical protein